MKFRLYTLIAMLLPCVAFANLDSITWKGTYYHATPIKHGITKKYCQDHTPGSFVHTVKSALTKPIMTDNGIMLDQTTFNVEKIGRLHLMYGRVVASGKIDNLAWHERINYVLYKSSEAGETKGIWYSANCKGLYRGVALSK